MDKEELIRAKAAITRRDKIVGKASMRLGAIIAVVSLILVILIVSINGPLTDDIGSIIAYILALGAGIGVAMMLYGLIQYWSSKS